MSLQQEFDALFNEARACQSVGRVAEAALLETKAAHLVESARAQVQSQPENLDTAANLLFLAERDWAVLGDHPDVQSALERAAAIRERLASPADASPAEALAKLAEFHFVAARWTEAETFYRRACVRYKKAGQTESAGFGQSEAGLAQALAVLGRLEEAETHFLTAIPLAERHGENKRVLYFIYTAAADNFEKRGRAPEAESLRAKAAALLPKANPGEHGFQV